MLQSRTFRSFETYLVVAFIYLALSILIRRAMIVSGERVLGGVS